MSKRKKSVNSEFKVTLAFGAQPGDPYTYTYSTEAEFRAFLEGINTAVGYVEVWATDPSDWKYVDDYAEIRLLH